MSGLAKHLYYNGYTITGSDKVKQQTTKELLDLGVKVFLEHDAKNVSDVQAVVFSSAIKDDNPEIVKAKEIGLPLIKRSVLLGEIMKDYQKSVAISGSHGKTTATAMLSKILITDGKDPTVFLGGEDQSFGNYRLGNSQYLVAEACEYKKSFLDLKPKIAVVLNVDNDHLDCYGSMQELIKAFKTFVGDNLAVVNADDQNAYSVSNFTTVSYGIKNSATYLAKNLVRTEKGYSFSVYAYSRYFGRINLSVKGKHNVYNALSAIATADLMGVSFNHIKRALEDFRGVKRRNEYLGEKLNKRWYADYAHHPKEIVSTLQTFNEDKEEYITIFQPHTYSRTRILLDEFISVLKDTKNLIIYKTYPAREKYDKQGSARTLVQRLKDAGLYDCEYAHTSKLLVEIVSSKSKIKKVLVLGAGDIYEIAKRITNSANDKKPKKKTLKNNT